MKYFAEFDGNGERKAGYVADGMPYSEEDIREQFPQAVEISAEDQALYVSNNYIRAPETGKPVERPPYVPSREEILTQELLALDTEYQPQFQSLQLAWAAAGMDGNTDLAARIQQDYAALKSEYQTKKEAIINGNS